MSISPSTRKTVAKRANYLCEYCLSPQDFSTQSHSIEHILPKIKKGSDEPENLALACQGCNSYKSDKTEAIDPFTKRISPLYNPRTDIWKDHFIWSDDYLEIIGTTAKGSCNRKPFEIKSARCYQSENSSNLVWRTSAEVKPTVCKLLNM